MPWTGMVARLASILLISYWGLFALLSPLTNWDSHVYNLARLPIAGFGGLFGNTHWTNPRQLMFPWSFDAIHLPLISLGFGYGLPSFLCLAGTLAVAWGFLSRRHGRAAGWMGVLALLALPTLVYQAVITKNDIPVLFGLAVWFHAMRLWRGDGRRIHLAFAALSIAFMCGAKTSGIIPAAPCFLISAALLRRSRARLAGFVAATLSCCILMGSAETYVESYRHFGHPMGPVAVVRDQSNRDGLRGAAANVIRYAMGNIDLGVEIWQHPDRVTPALESSCLRWLPALGMANAGYRSDFNDGNMGFLVNFGDAGSNYGPLGTIGLCCVALAAFWWRPGEDWWRMCAFGGLLFAGICWAVAWMPWNDRFLLVPFAVVSVGFVALVYRYFPGNQAVAAGLLALLLYPAIAYPLVSYNKRPADLIAAVADRPRQEFKERPSMQAVAEGAQDWRAAHPGGRLYLLAGGESWVLPFFMGSGRDTVPVETGTLEALLRDGPADGRPSALLILNRPDFLATGTPLTVIRTFSGEASTELCEIALRRQ